MIKRLIRSLAPWLAFFFVFAFFGCSGGNSTSNAIVEPTTLVAQTFDEKCALCHKASSIVDVQAVHSQTTTGPDGKITSVTFNGGLVTVNFKLFDGANNLIPIGNMSAAGIRFTLAKLVPGSNGDASKWVSYINTTETVASGAPGNSPDGTPTPAGTKQIQATSERASTANGVFTNNGDGTYSYQFSFNITNVTSPVAVSYEPNLTHRIAMQVTGNISNPYLDFVPNGGALPNTRNLVVNASCNECHIKLGLHGGGRIQTTYCVTCHNPGTTDANSGNTVDFKVLIHKIHSGKNLPSVADLGRQYAIWGNQNSLNDYSKVVYPQDIRFPGLGQATNTCTKCHQRGDASDSDNWNTVPTRESCTSCHDDISFTASVPTGFTLHPGGAQADNSQCAVCHPPTGGQKGIIDAHIIPARVAGQAYKYNIVSITDPQGGSVDPGDLVKVTFSVTDPTHANAAYNILTNPAFTASSGGASRLAVLIGWDTKDITNRGNGNNLAQPISINPLSTGTTPATNNNDGTFSVTSTVAIPSTVTGSGVAAIEGHPAGDFDGDGAYTDRVPVANAVMSFPIAGAAARDRRTVVDVAKCDSCHGQLSVHGNNRTDNPQVCIICHNANATDLSQRPANAQSAVDGKAEEAIDFKYMVHAIHAGSVDADGFREKGIVVYGFGKSANDFSEVALPAGDNNLRNCAGCHTGSTFTVPPDTNILPTTILSGTDLANPDDDTNITPTASVCSSCHDAIDAKTHITDQGGKFDFVAFKAEPVSASTGVSQADLCGPGPISAQPAGHTDRVDCCSCHSAK